MPIDRILAGRLVAILRADRGEHLVEAARAIAAGGIDCVEVTFTVPRADLALEQVADALGEDVLLGAGTILDTETARIALLAGARYLVTPTFNPSVIELGRRYGVPVLSGAFTPTEILAAWQAGSELVKVFPSGRHGPGLPACHPRPSAAGAVDADRRRQSGYGRRLPRCGRRGARHWWSAGVEPCHRGRPV